MKKLLLILCVSLFTMSACNKEGDSPNDSSTAGWKLGGTDFSQVLFRKVPSGVFVAYQVWDKIPTSAESAANSNTFVALNGVSVLFKSAPTASGKYKIVVTPDPSTLNADEMMISVEDKTRNKRYASTATTVLADVTVNGWKLTIKVPTTKVLQQGLLGGETLDFSCTLVEQ